MQSPSLRAALAAMCVAGACSSDDGEHGDGTTGTSSTGTETGDFFLRLCSIDWLDPTVDPAAAIDAGDGAGQIPRTIGDAFLRNCGCHYTTKTLMPPYPSYHGKVPLRSLENFHADFDGVFPQNYADKPTYQAVEQRLLWNPSPMPHPVCQVEDEGGNITAADFALLIDWLEADAPDGATYP